MKFQKKYLKSDVWSKENLSINETLNETQNLTQANKLEKMVKAPNKERKITKENVPFQTNSIKTRMKKMFRQIQIQPISGAINQKLNKTKQSKNTRSNLKNKAKSSAKTRTTNLKMGHKTQANKPQFPVDEWIELLMRVYNLNFTNDFDDLNYFKQVLRQRNNSLVAILQTPILEKQKLFEPKMTSIERILESYWRVISQLKDEFIFLKKLASSKLSQNDSEKWGNLDGFSDSKELVNHSKKSRVSQPNLLVYQNEISPSILLSSDFEPKESSSKLFNCF